MQLHVAFRKSEIDVENLWLCEESFAKLQTAWPHQPDVQMQISQEPLSSLWISTGCYQPTQGKVPLDTVEIDHIKPVPYYQKTPKTNGDKSRGPMCLESLASGQTESSLMNIHIQYYI